MLSFFITAALLLSQTTDKCVATIDEIKISLNEFNRCYYAHNKGFYNVKTNEEIDRLSNDETERSKNPMLSREVFLDQLLDQKIVCIKAEKDGATNEEEFIRMRRMQEEFLISGFYIKTKLESKINVSDEEVADVYANVKDNLNGAAPEDVSRYIKQQITEEKLSRESEIFAANLRSKADVKLNEELMKTLVGRTATEKTKDEWLVKIGGEEISARDLENFYYTQNMNAYESESREEIDKLSSDENELAENPFLSKSVFLEKMINQKIICANARAEKFTDNDDLNSILHLQVGSMTVWYYAKTRLSKNITVTDEEISVFYKENADKFQGLPAEQAEKYIRTGVKARKLKLKTSDLIANLRYEAKIEKNQEVLNSKN